MVAAPGSHAGSGLPPPPQTSACCHFLAAGQTREELHLFVAVLDEGGLVGGLPLFLTPKCLQLGGADSSLSRGCLLLLFGTQLVEDFSYSTSYTGKGLLPCSEV